MTETLKPDDALEEMRELLRMAALDGALVRQAAARYTLCRETLLQSAHRPLLPGFLLQCLTIARFQDFIHLLDPRPTVRLAFLDDAFRNVATPNSSRPGTIDVFGEDF